VAKRYELGSALIRRHDTRGCDILMELLPAKAKVNNGLRSSVYYELNATLHTPLERSRPDLEQGIPTLMAWWQTNKDSVRKNGGVPVSVRVTSVYTSAITSNSVVRYTDANTPTEVFVATSDLIEYARAHAQKCSGDFKERELALADTLARREKEMGIIAARDHAWRGRLSPVLPA